MLKYIIFFIVFLVLLYFVITLNKLIKLNNKVKEAFATMDVYLKKRWDLIPSVVETVKGYSKHEKETLKEIAELRKSVYDNLSNEEKIKTNIKISSGIKRLVLLAESYPELKSSKNFLELQNDLRKVEDEIAQSRKYYNATIREYNNKVEMIPSNIVAAILGYKRKSMFEVSEGERDSVEVNL